MTLAEIQEVRRVRSERITLDNAFYCRFLLSCKNSLKNCSSKMNKSERCATLTGKSI